MFRAGYLSWPKTGKFAVHSRQKRYVCGDFMVAIIAIQKEPNPSFRCKTKTLFSISITNLSETT